MANLSLGARWTPEEVKALVGSKNMTEALNACPNRTANAIKKKAQELGKRLSTQNITPKGYWTEEKLNQLKRLRKKNLPRVEIAEIMGITWRAVEYAVKQYDLPPIRVTKQGNHSLKVIYPKEQVFKGWFEDYNIPSGTPVRVPARSEAGVKSSMGDL